MTFLHAGILGAGLACVSIPILIHLLMRRRRKPIEWGAMRFIIEAYQRTRKRMLIERWLLLACRCLLVALIAIALGRPLLGDAARSSGGRVVFIIIDDSIASGATREQTSALARHQRAARDLLRELGDGDRAALISLSSPARGMVLPPSADLSSVARLIDELTPTDARADLTSALALVAQSITDSGKTLELSATGVVVLSDFHTGTAELTSPLTKLPASVRLFASPPAPGLANLAITSIAPLRGVLTPGQAGPAQSVAVNIERSGPIVQSTQSTTVRLRVEAPGLAPGAEVSAPVRFAPGERVARVTLAIDPPSSTGTSVLVAQLEGDANIQDNVFRLPIETREALRVGIVAGPEARGSGSLSADRIKPGDWLALALRPSDNAQVDLVDIDPGTIDAPRLAGLDAIAVLSPQSVSDAEWKRLRTACELGALVMVFPPSELSVHSWPDTMNAALGLKLNFARQAIDLPDAGARLDSANAGRDEPGDLLTGIRSELEELSRPVTIFRQLALTPGEKPSGTPVLSATGAGPLIIAARPGEAEATTPRGQVLIFTSAMDLKWTSLPATPMMVPLMQELLRQGIGRARPALWQPAGELVKAPPQTVELRRAGSTGVVTIAPSGLSTEPVRTAGLWQAVDARGGVRGLIAINPDSRGSRADEQPEPGVGAWLSAALGTPEARAQFLKPAGDQSTISPARALASAGKSSATGPLLLAGALLLALTELVLARRASHPSPVIGGVHA